MGKNYVCTEPKGHEGEHLSLGRTIAQHEGRADSPSPEGAEPRDPPASGELRTEAGRRLWRALGRYPLEGPGGMWKEAINAIEDEAYEQGAAIERHDAAIAEAALPEPSLDVTDEAAVRERLKNDPMAYYFYSLGRSSEKGTGGATDE
jgi:hypothetical protein